MAHDHFQNKLLNKRIIVSGRKETGNRTSRGGKKEGEALIGALDRDIIYLYHSAQL